MQQTAPLIACRWSVVLAAIAVGGFSVWKAWTVIPNTSENTAINHPPAVETREPRHGVAVLNKQAVHSLNLFGQRPVEPITIDADTLPDTTLALQLVGIIGHSNADTARSLIAEAGKPALAYFPGDTLPGDAKLVRIDRQFVIVQRGEQLEKLQFAGSVSTARTPAKRRSIAEAVTETPSRPVPVAESIDPNNPEAVYDGLRDRLAAIRRAQEKQ